jgi:hypothetical protein
MPHEYEVDVETGANGQQQTHIVVVHDHQHHQTLKDTAEFFALIASILSLPREVIKAARWMRKR